MTMNLLSMPTSLRPHQANAVRIEWYSAIRAARLQSADDERSLADRVRRGLELQARLRSAPVPRCRALVALR